MDDVVPEQSVLSSPITRGVESTGFESIKTWEDTVNVEIAVLATDGIQTCLKVERIGLLCVVFETTCARVLQVTGIEPNLLAGGLVLLCLKFGNSSLLIMGPPRSPPPELLDEADDSETPDSWA